MLKYQKSWSIPPTKSNHIYYQPLKDLYRCSHCWLYSRYISRPFIHKNCIARHVKQNIKQNGHEHLFSLWGMPYSFPCYHIKNCGSSKNKGRKDIVLQFFFFFYGIWPEKKSYRDKASINPKQLCFFPLFVDKIKFI